MRKRIIALLLALILTVGLLPTVALAAEPTAPTDETPGEDAVSFTKDVVTKNGQDMIKIEAYVNGDVKTQVTTTPCDIVLVLDQSGSMAGKIKAPGYDYTKVSGDWSYNRVNSGIYYYHCDRCEDYHKVEAEWDYSFDGPYYYLVYDCPYNYNWDMLYNGSEWWRWDADDTIYTGTLYTRTETAGSNKTKVEALKEAANTFLQVVSESATANKVNHRVSIVGFGSAGIGYTNTEVLSVEGYYSSYQENGSRKHIGQQYSSYGRNRYKNSLVAINSGTSINPMLTNAVKAVEANGATAVDLGLDMASRVFSNQDAATQEEYTDGTRAKIVVVVTDGIPTHSRGLETKVASTAINTAGNLEKNGAKVFAVGIALDTVNEEDGGTGATPTNAKNFISWVSSDYPDATSWENHGDPITGAPKYGIEVSTADSLKSIFADIAKESTNVSASAKLTSTAIMSDTLSDYFNLPANADTSKIEVYTSAASYNNGTLTWGDETPYSATVTISPDKKTISVTNFDYTANCVTEKAKAKEGNDFGKKLVIYIPIEKDATKAQFGGYLPTNDDATLNDPKGDKGYKADGAHKDCTVVAPTLNGKNEQIDAGSSYLTTDLFTGSQWPDGSNNAGVEMVYTIRDSTGATVATKTVPAGKNSAEVDWGFATGKQNNNTYPTPGTYTFTIDCTVSCTNPKETTKHTATSTTETGTITVKRTTATVTLTKTITGLSDGDKTTVLTGLRIYAKDSKNVEHELEKDATSGTYSAELAAGTYTIVEKNYDGTGYDCTTSGDTTFTVVADTNMSLTLTNAYTAKKYNITYQYENTPAGAPPVPGPFNNVEYNSEQEVAEAQTLTGWTFSGWTTEDVEVAADGTFSMPDKNVTFTGRWTEKDKATISYVVVGPEGCGTVAPTSETLYVDAESASGSTANAGTNYRFVGWYDNLDCSGTALSTNDTYVPPKPEAGWISATYYAKFESLTYTITFKTENGGKINNQTDDITYPDLTAGTAFPDVPRTKENPGYYFDGWYKDGNKVTDFPTTVTENATYTAKWLSYNSINLDLTGKIQKTLNSDVELSNESFTINLTLDGAEVASATATATVSATTASGTGYTGSAPFQTATDEFKLPFTAPGTYNYSIVEAEDGQLAGMTYDVGFANGHTMIVNVDENTTTNELYVKSVTIDGKTVYTHGETEATPTWLTITNNYVEPKNAQVTNKEVVVTQPEDPLKTAVDAFEITSQVTVLYPTGNGTTSNTLEVSYGTTAATLLYKITVYAGTESSYTFEDKDASFVYAENAKTVTKNGDYFTVTFEDGAEYAYVYVAVTHAISYDADGEYKARNFIGSQGAETTVTEKDPNKLTINFADFVKKELTATGSKTANDVKFRVIVNGMESPYMMYNVGEEEVSTYAAFDPKYSTVLNVNFASITGGNTETEWFIADNSIVIDQAGIYYFELNEEDGKRTGVTYDDSIYKVLVYVERKDDKLVVKSFDIMKDNVYVDGDTLTFHNTIDTGKDDYYPIIIPTIINKDTGMLNKTDHFAYVIGYPDGTVHPNGQITRAEVATIFFRLLRDEVRDGAFTTSNTYSDVAYGKWYNNPISTMSALGIITGYPDGTFKPNKPITRAEFAAIAARFDETQSGKSATFSDVIGHWAAKEIGIAYYNDWIKGYPDGTFKPDQNITRAEAMTLINRVLERKPESPADLLTNMNKWTDNMDTSKWYYLDVQEATNSHGYTRKTFNYELWRQMLTDPDWSRYER